MNWSSEWGVIQDLTNISKETFDDMQLAFC